MLCLFILASHVPLEIPVELIGAFSPEVAAPSSTVPNFNGRYLKTSLLYQERDEQPVSSAFYIRSYGDTCFANVADDDDFWRQKLTRDGLAFPQSMKRNALYYLQDGSTRRVFGIGNFGFTNTAVNRACNGSGYVYTLDDSSEVWSPTDGKGTAYTGEQLIAGTAPTLFESLSRLDLGREVTETNYQQVCRMLSFSVMPTLTEVSIDSPYSTQLLCALAKNTTLRNLREIKTDAVDETVLTSMRRLYFCLPLTRDVRQQEPRSGLDVATIRINARVDRDRLAEINQELAGKPLAISYLSNDDHDRAVLRLTV